MAILDLSQETFRQTLVDKEKGQYLGHPATTLLSDGKTIIAVYPKGHGGGAIVMKRSGDGGITWSDRLPTPESWETSKEAPTIYRLGFPNERVVVLFSGHYPIRTSVSYDNGNTWNELEQIFDFGGILPMASLVKLKNGDYMGLFHDDGSMMLTKLQSLKNVKKVTRESKDAGKT